MGTWSWFQGNMWKYGCTNATLWFYTVSDWGIGIMIDFTVRTITKSQYCVGASVYSKVSFKSWLGSHKLAGTSGFTSMGWWKSHNFTKLCHVVTTSNNADVVMQLYELDHTLDKKTHITSQSHKIGHDFHEIYKNMDASTNFCDFVMIATPTLGVVT